MQREMTPALLGGIVAAALLLIGLAVYFFFIKPDQLPAPATAGRGIADDRPAAPGAARGPIGRGGSEKANL